MTNLKKLIEKQTKNVMDIHKGQMDVIIDSIEDMSYEERSVADFDESRDGNWNIA